MALRIKILCVGKLKGAALEAVVSDYAGRIRRMAQLEIVEVADESAPQRLSEAQLRAAREREAARLLSKLDAGETLIALDISGQMVDSEGVASKMQQFMGQGNSRLAFVIGSTLGLAPEVIQRAAWRWSFSRLTFPHGLMRAMVLEQVYRALTIHNHLPYNK